MYISTEHCCDSYYYYFSLSIEETLLTNATKGEGEGLRNESPGDENAIPKNN